jgi:mannose-6-phosphate isomerase-like protein (cupin superfamily)
VSDATYGLTFEQVNQIIRPTPVVQPWGQVVECASRAEYAMHRIHIRAGAVQPLGIHVGADPVYFVERGPVILRRVDRAMKPSAHQIETGGVVSVDATEAHGFASLTDAVVYRFASAPLSGVSALEPGEKAAAMDASTFAHAAPATDATETVDRRDKYWGAIETIASDHRFAAKRILLRAGGQSSLEYHVQKRETYFVESGKVKVGLRVGRAENRSLILQGGEGFDIRPGLMHMRIAVEDSVILEVSTPDSDSDSYLVEDGRTYQHVERS